MVLFQDSGRGITVGAASPLQKALGDYQDLSYALLSEDRGTRPTLLQLNLFLAPWIPTPHLLLPLQRLLPLGEDHAERNTRCLNGLHATEREAIEDVDGVLGTLFWGALCSYLEELQEWLLKGFPPKDPINIFLVFQGNQVMLRNLPFIRSFLRHLAHNFPPVGRLQFPRTVHYAQNSTSARIDKQKISNSSKSLS